MRNSWASLLYRDRRALVLLVGLVLVAGFSSLAMLPRMEDPLLSPRTAVVTVPLDGADAIQVETLVVEPLEAQFQDIGEIGELRSTSRSNIGVISIELRDEVTEPESVWSEIRGKIDESIAQLPAGSGRPRFEELEVRAYALIVGLVWEDDSPADFGILRRYAMMLEDDLRAVPSTEIVDRFADPGEEITVTVDPELAAGLAMNAGDVAVALASGDAKSAAGSLRTPAATRSIELDNEFRQTDRIADTLIRSGDAASAVRIGDIADVRRTVPDPIPRFAKIDGRPAIALGAMVRPKTRIDRWRIRAGEVLDRFESRLPAGIGIEIVLDQNRYVESRLSNLAGNLMMGVIAVVTVIFILMGWRASLVVAAALPLSGLAVLFALRGLDIPIHQMSITGLIISMGLLIDNAIVMVDEIDLELRGDVSPAQAIASSVGHLAIPLLGSTITTALAFAPIAMMAGPAGEFVGSIAISVILAISASLFFSLTVISSLAAMFLSRGSGQGGERTFWRNGFRSGRLTAAYRRVVTWLLERPRRGVAVALAPPLVGFAMASRLPEQFFPPADRDQFYVELEMPPDASIAATESAADQIDRELSNLDARKVSWFLGESPPRFYYNFMTGRRGEPGYAAALVQMESAEAVGEVTSDLQRRLDRVVPEARVLVRQLEQGPPFRAPIELRFFGPDLDTLERLGDEARAILAGVPEVTHTKSMVGETLPTIRMNINESASRSIGMGPSELSAQLFDQLEGRRAGSILEDTQEIPVRVRVASRKRATLTSISTLQVTAGDSLVPVDAMATIGLSPERSAIVRIDGLRINEIAGYINVGVLPSVPLGEFTRRLAASDLKLPPGYRVEFGGEASKRNEAVGNLLANVSILAVLMLATLVLSFRSFRQAGMIVAVAVSSVGLGMIGLYVGGYPFGFMAIIGTMGLIGVAINDSIVVLASLRGRLADLGGTMRLDEAVDVVVACTRHVVATTLTTIAGFAPLIIDGGRFWPPLAITIAGGVSGATLLALVLIPALFRMQDRVGFGRV